MSPSRPTDRWLGAALCAGLVAIFLWMVRGLLVPLALGGLFALLLAPLQRRLRGALGKRAGVAPAILTLGTFVVVVIPFAIIAAQAVVSINDFLTQGTKQIVDTIQDFGARHLSWLAERLDLHADAVRQHVVTLLQRAGLLLASLAGNFAQALPGRVVSLFLFALALYYGLRDGRALVRFLARLLPFRDEDTERLFTSVQQTVQGALLGQLLTSGVQGALTIAALFVFGVPGALVFGLVATILSVIPLVGTTPVTVGATVFLVASGRYGAAVGMLVAAVVIGFSDEVTRPLAQSSRARLHPLLVLASIFGGLEVFGAAGVFLGPVLAALAVWALDVLADPPARAR